MPAKAYLRTLQAGLIASLLIVFFVFNDLLFPYITSKQLPFNILMELLFAVWLVFLLRYPQYRPRRSYITVGLVVFFVAILASCAVSVNLTLSFWGNAERMLGLFPLLHFFIFYLILITVFRSWEEWKFLFFSSVVIATLVAVYGIFGPNTFSTLGNTTYVSAYLIFNLFFALILFYRSPSRSGRWFYVLPALIMLYEFWICHTSGAVIGLALGVLLLFFLLGLWHQRPVWRRAYLICSLAAIVVIAGLFSQQQSAWFQNSFLRNLTFAKDTFQTRLISWRSAAEDFHNHWLFGTGFGNYAIIFDKYFDSSFFNYARSDTYFDRAHNNLIDIASTTGAVGLLAYLSILVAAVYYLYRNFQRQGRRAGTADPAGLANLEILILVALLAAYFIQNLVVFDSYVTYIGLMITLGFIYWLAAPGPDAAAATEPAERRFVLAREWEIVILIVLLVAAYVFTSEYNLKPWRMFQGTIAGYSDIISGQLADGVLAYQAALTGTPLDHDARVTLVNLISAHPELLSSVPQAGAEAILEYTIGLAQADVSMNPSDSLMQLQLAQILDTAARFNYQDMSKFNDYSGQALQAMDQSIAASPGRAPLYLIEGQMHMFRGENDEAIKDAQYAISLNPQYEASYCRLAEFYLVLKDNAKMADPLNKCVDLGGAGDLTSSDLVDQFVNYYVGQKDYARIIPLANQLGELNPTDAPIWLNLAKVYWASGDQAKASTTVDRAIGLDPKQAAAWQTFLKGVPAATGTPAGK